MIKKQQQKIFIFGVAAIVLILVYFIIIAPMVEKAMRPPEAEIPNLLEGEVLGIQNRILIMEHIEQADMQSIEVHNRYGTYAFDRDKNDEFQIRNNKNTPYSKEAFSSLVVSTGYTLSMMRVMEHCDDMSEYGLDPSDDPAWYKITKLDRTEHIVYVGDMIPTGAGFYCRYADRDAVYILDSTLAYTVLQDVKVLIVPILSFPLSSTQYYMTKDFYIQKYGDLFVYITYLTEEERSMFAAQENTVYRMVHPAGYQPSVTNYDVVLQTFVNNGYGFMGTRTMEYGPPGDVLDDEILLSYGIDPENPAYVVHYATTQDGVNYFSNIILFSELTADGRYYAYSMMFNLIAEVDPSIVEYLNWDIIKFVDRPIFQRNINDIAKIEIISPEVNETFNLEGEGQDILITPMSTGKTFNKDEVQNFRQFYKVLLSLQLEDYTENTSTDDLMATIIITTRAGFKFEYKFYPYSTRRAFFTIDGKGEFYLLRSMVDKMLSDCVKAVNFVPIDSDAHY